MTIKRKKRPSAEALRRKRKREREREREREQNNQRLELFANSLRELLGLGPLYQITEWQR